MFRGAATLGQGAPRSPVELVLEWQPVGEFTRIGTTTGAAGTAGGLRGRQAVAQGRSHLGHVPGRGIALLVQLLAHNLVGDTAIVYATTNATTITTVDALGR